MTWNENDDSIICFAVACRDVFKEIDWVGPLRDQGVICKVKIPSNNTSNQFSVAMCSQMLRRVDSSKPFGFGIVPSERCKKTWSSFNPFWIFSRAPHPPAVQNKNLHFVGCESWVSYELWVSIASFSSEGIKWTLIGHSERRTKYGETDADVAEKALEYTGIKHIAWYVICAFFIVLQFELGYPSIDFDRLPKLAVCRFFAWHGSIQTLTHVVASEEIEQGIQPWFFY